MESYKTHITNQAKKFAKEVERKERYAELDQEARSDREYDKACERQQAIREIESEDPEQTEGRDV